MYATISMLIEICEKVLGDHGQSQAVYTYQIIKTLSASVELPISLYFCHSGYLVVLKHSGNYLYIPIKYMHLNIYNRFIGIYISLPNGTCKNLIVWSAATNWTINLPSLRH